MLVHIESEACLRHAQASRSSDENCMSRQRLGLTIGISIIAGSTIACGGEGKNVDLPPLGEFTYNSYCALCHGIGAGPGMFADALRKGAPDLTQITKRNGGMFPDEKVAAIIRDGGVSGHGTMRLLAWEKYFRRDFSDEHAEHLIRDLVEYLKVHQSE